jgi:hypothetical protein
MKIITILLPVTLIAMAFVWFVKPRSLKNSITGCWACMATDTEYANRSFQLLFYKDDKFYYYLKERLPTPSARGNFEINDSVITLIFSDTNEKQTMTVRGVAPKRLSVTYNNTQLTFRRMQALKTSK